MMPTHRRTNLKRGHELNGTDDCEVCSGFKVQLERVDEVQTIDTNVHEHVQHLDALGGIYRNYNTRTHVLVGGAYRGRV